eukprot:s7824_g6.t1
MEEAVETFLKGPRQKAEGDQLDSGKPSDDGCGLPSANPDGPGDGPPEVIPVPDGPPQLDLRTCRSCGQLSYWAQNLWDPWTEPKKSEPQVPLTKRQEWFNSDFLRFRQVFRLFREKKKKKGKTPDNQWWTNCDTPAKNQGFGDWQDWGDASSSPWHQKGASVDNSSSGQ